METLTCYPKSPTYVMYRARLEGTSETDSDSLISLIEDWVKGGPALNITGWLKVDSECSVRVLSFDKEGCSSASPSPPSPSRPDLLFLIIISAGGLVTAIIISTVLIVIIVLLMRWRKRRGSKPKL